MMKMNLKIVTAVAAFVLFTNPSLVCTTEFNPTLEQSTVKQTTALSDNHADEEKNDPTATSPATDDKIKTKKIFGILGGALTGGTLGAFKGFSVGGLLGAVVAGSIGLIGGGFAGSQLVH